MRLRSTALVCIGAAVISYGAVGRAADRPAGSARSPNWSGYVVQSPRRFTRIVGTWVEPAVSCTSDVPHARSAYWIGLDGYSNQTVEQIGTEADCDGASPFYFAWWQMYPTPFVRLDSSSYPVNPGDTLTATVSRSGKSYRLSLSSSEGWTYSTVQKATAADDSAEWIASSPKLCPTCGYAPLARFGSVRFESARAAAGGRLLPISAYRHDGPVALTMRRATGIVRARPSRLGGHGECFTVTWQHS